MNLDSLKSFFAGASPVTQRLLQVAVILLISLAAAWVADRLLTGIIHRLTRKTTTDFDDRLLELLHRPIKFTVILAGLVLSTRVLALPSHYEFLVLGVLKTVAVLVLLGFTLRFVSLVLETLSENSQRFGLIDPQTLPFFNNLGRLVLVGGAAYFLFLSWKIDVTAWLASAGIIGIAVGFAAKDTLANLFAGLFIFADSPYKVGDFIILDSRDRGRVTHIGIRSTRLLTRDDIEITVPNAVIANAKIINESGGPWQKERVRIKVGVAYGSDVDQVEGVLLDVAAGIESVCDEPAPRVRFRSFGDSGLDFELLCWIDEPVLRGRVVHALNIEVYKRFEREGIEIPFPVRDVILRSPPPAPPAGDPGPS